MTGLCLDTVLLVYNPLSPSVQPVFSPPLCPAIWAVLHQFVNEDVVGGSGLDFPY